MGRKLKATHYWGSQCEVTGKVDTSQEESVVSLDDVREGLRLFPESDIEWMHGNVSVQGVTPDGAVVIASSCEKYTVTEGSEYRTSTYTLDGRHKWCYTFEIMEE